MGRACGEYKADFTITLELIIVQGNPPIRGAIDARLSSVEFVR
jgi:hypothetical protein